MAVDAIAFTCKIDPADLLHLRMQHWGARGSQHIVPVLRLCDARTESPMETRIRMALHEHGLPAPHVQFEVEAGGRVRRFDMAYPSVELAIEYDGGTTASREQRTRTSCARPPSSGSAGRSCGSTPTRSTATRLGSPRPSRTSCAAAATSPPD